MKIFDPQILSSHKQKFVLLIGTRNRKALLEKCLDTVLDQLNETWCVVVIDAGSSDGTVQMLQSFDHPQFYLVDDGEKLGQARSLNRVLKKLNCEYVGWISDDNLLVGNGINDALWAMEKDPNLGMVGLKVKDISGIYVNEPYIGGIWPTGVLNINQGVIRFDLFRELGFFDETYGSYGIDADLTTKVLLRGNEVALTRAVAIHHDRKHTEHPGAFTSDERKHENQRAQQMYRDRYHAQLKSLSFSLYKRVVGYLWWRFMDIRVLRPIRRLFFALVLKNRLLHFRDIQNVLFARWVSLFDLIKQRKQKIYLRQKISKRWIRAYQSRPGVLHKQMDTKLEAL